MPLVVDMLRVRSCPSNPLRLLLPLLLLPMLELTLHKLLAAKDSRPRASCKVIPAQHSSGSGSLSPSKLGVC
jgi:hypothetical protein